MMSCNTICCIYNSGAHYRWPIFKAMSDAFDIDFCFGPDTAYTKSIKTFDYDKLPGFSKLLRNRRLFGKFYWQSGAVAMAFKPYKKYIMLGEAYCLSSWLIALLAKLMGKKTICWTHGWYGRESGVKKMISKWFYQLFDEILTYNDYAGRLLKEGGIKPSKIRTIANSLDSVRHRQMRQDLKQTDIFSAHFNNSNPVLLYCGRIQQSKRLDLMLEAAKILKDKGVLANLVFVGKDDEQVGLAQQAKELGLSDQVWLYGPCYDEQKLAELFFNSTLCVSPGNVGLTAVHALSFGCPVITHDNLPYQGPEFESIQSGVTGDFFSHDNAQSLAAVVSHWLDRTPEQRSATAKAAFEEIDRKWNVDYQISVFRQVLE